MATPQVMVQHSDDHGHTWSKEVWKPLVGDDKNYLTRIRIHRGGSAMQRIYRISFTDNAPFAIISMHGEVVAGL